MRVAEDGQLTEHWAVVDRWGVFQQVGLFG